MNAVEMRERHLNLFAQLARDTVLFGLRQLAGNIAACFVDRSDSSYNMQSLLERLGHLSIGILDQSVR
jgi:hypothetical protein